MRRITILTGIFILIAFFPATSFPADADIPKPLTLSESISIALSRSLPVNSAREAVRGAAAQTKEAFTAFLPQLSTSYGYTKLNEEPSFLFPGLSFTIPTVPPVPVSIPGSNLSTGTRDNYTWNIQLRQPVYAGGAIKAGYDASRIDAEIASSEEKKTILDVVRDVRISYFTILKAQRALEVASQSLKRLSGHRDAAASFYDAGMIARNDLLRAEVELAGGRQHLLQAQNSLEMAKSGFNTLLRRNINTPVAVEDSMTESVISPPLDVCIAAALKDRPEIQSGSLRLQHARTMVRHAESGRYPTVSIVGSYERYGDTPGVSGSPYRDQENWHVMAQANWNIWDWGKARYRVESGNTLKNRTEDALSALKDQIALEVKNSYLLLLEAQNQLPVDRKAVEQAEENFRINKERYTEQVGTATDVIDAQTLLTATMSAYQNHIGDLNIAKIRLDRTMGKTFTDSVQ